MPRDSFHHGNLRAELLDRGVAVLRERGLDALSLRELARDAGISHGAPRSHFADRAALLEALAERGFLRLAEALEAVQGDAGERRSADVLLREAGHAYLRFAAQNPSLLDLMFAAKASGPSEQIQAAAGRLFVATRTLVAAAVAPRFGDDADIERLSLVLSATVQGVSALVSSGRITAQRGDALLDDALQVFLAGAGAVCDGAPSQADR